VTLVTMAADVVADNLGGMLNCFADVSKATTSLRVTVTALAVFLTVSFLTISSGLCQESGSSELSPIDRQLISATSNDDLKSVDRLLKQGAHIEARGSNGATPLIIAAGNGNLALVNFLLDHGANPRSKDEQEETPLIHAARSGNPAVVKVFLHHRHTFSEKNRALLTAAEGGPVVVQINSPSTAQPSAQHLRASESPWTKTVRLLLAEGAGLESRNTDGSTPLIIAASFAQTEIVTELLKRGANIAATDKNGNTALIAAACECAVATMNRAYDVVKLLLAKGAKVNARSHDGTTALINAAGGFGDAAIVKLLLDHGANPFAKDSGGNTALSWAVKKDSSEKAHLLKTAMAKSH